MVSPAVCVCVCACVPPEWRHRLVEAGLVLCGPKHCRVMNDLMAGEVSSVLRPSQDAHRHLRPAEVIHSRDPANCRIDILHKLDFFWLLFMVMRVNM